MISKSILLSSLLAACVLGLGSNLWAQAGDAKEPPVVQKGDNLVEVTVTGGGMSEDEAVADAKRKAVERGAGAFIYSQSKTENFVLVKDSILVRSAGFLQSFEKVSRKEIADGTFEVKIKAVVSLKGIEDYWGVVTNLLKDKGRPKIMVFVNERIGHDLQEDSTVQARIEAKLLESGFLLVNKEQIKEIDKKDLAAAAAEDSPAKVQAIAKRFGAQIFISGTAVAASGGPKNIGGVEFFTYESTANIKVYRSDDAMLMSSVPGQPERGVQRVARSAATQSLDLLAQKIALKVRDDILTRWADDLSGRGELKLELEGVTFRQANDVKKSLKSLKEVKDVNVELANGVATFSIQSEVSAQKLAETISDKIEAIDISDVTANVMKGKFKAK